MNIVRLTIRKDGEQRHVEIEVEGPRTIGQVSESDTLQLDIAKLDQLHYALDLEQKRHYGTLLGRAVFTEKIQAKWHEAQSGLQPGERLHVMLSVEVDELRGKYRWERLCFPRENRDDTAWDFLRLSQNFAFSLDLRSRQARKFPALSRAGLRAVIVVADLAEDGESYGLARFNCEQTVQGILAAIGRQIDCRVLAGSRQVKLPDAIALPTLDNLYRQLSDFRPAILHLVCHGESCEQDFNLFLPESERVNQGRTRKTVATISATKLIDELNRLNVCPHLIYLCSCSSADPMKAQGLGGLGQRLVKELAIPSVVGMTEPVRIDLATDVARRFYQQLVDHGQVDVALSQALAGWDDSHQSLIPVLFSRLDGRPLFEDTEHLTYDDWDSGLARMQQEVTRRAPVLQDDFENLRNEVLPVLAAWRQAQVGPGSAAEEAAHFTVLRGLQNSLNELSRRFFPPDDRHAQNFDELAKKKLPSNYNDTSPFRGLKSFDLSSSNFFFGRAEEEKNLDEKLQRKSCGHRFVAVVGGSGSGKSSLVKAGLLRQMKKRLGRDPRSILVTPGTDPLARLQAARQQVDNPDLLIVDQFEELFTHGHTEPRQKEFLQELLLLCQQTPAVVTLRDSYLGACLTHSNVLRDLLSNGSDNHLLVLGSLQGESLRTAVQQQLRAVDMKFEPGLAVQIFDDLANQPGEMPLLQFCLHQLWELRHGSQLMLCRYQADEETLSKNADYRHVGGVREALSRHADTELQTLAFQDDGAEELARLVFERLVQMDAVSAPDGSSSTQDVRRREQLPSLCPQGTPLERITEIVNFLASANLLVTSRDAQTDVVEVEIAHEALINHWPTMRRWLAEARQHAPLVDRIRQDAREWREDNCNPDRLTLRGKVLKSARQRVASQPRRFNAHEADFVNKCRRQAWLRIFYSAVAIISVCVAIASVWWLIFVPPDPSITIGTYGASLPSERIPGGALTLYFTSLPEFGEWYSGWYYQFQ